MRKALRCMALVGVIGVSIWTAHVDAVTLTPTCESLRGTKCSPAGATTSCQWGDGKAGSCICNSGTWFCGIA